MDRWMTRATQVLVSFVSLITLAPIIANFWLSFWPTTPAGYRNGFSIALAVAIVAMAVVAFNFRERPSRQHNEIIAQIDLILYLLADTQEKTSITEKTQSMRDAVRISPNSPEQQAILRCLDKLDEWNKFVKPKLEQTHH